MSRYFTSPPPVYARNWGNGQNLVESTKIIERQVVTSNKVNRKEKKEKKHKNVKSIKQLYLPTKQVCDESEQLERSCLTEENVNHHHHVGYLSDGSQNSKKRRREASPAVESDIKATPVVGKPLRIRFVFKKPKEVEVVVPQEGHPVCSTSGIDKPLETSISGHEEKLLSSCPPESDKTAVPSESEKKKKHRISKESRYSSLFDEPVFSCISVEEDDNNNSDDWLLGARGQENAPLAKSLMNEDVVTNMHKSGDSCFPRPQFLPEVEIFSLPYTVLF
ncbi:hypothetical protein N665_0046s0064 [Sinapis alba]|nr:hypothetical protein N665_0046s0064 [Sinapis alba]